ncbi:MAG: hypothetical protein M1828_001386 [Chrysothrix sp. TS-e1954]|nr:MAG: hypothetical protein M1828_001386 [Chrysothrix sp. TS-e1954]
MSLGPAGAQLNPEQADNFEDIEKQFAVKVVQHMETYWKILERKPGSQLRLTKIDDEIHEKFRESFPDFDPTVTINEDDMKSKEGKEQWRNFVNQFEKKVDDYNFGTMIRANPKWEYGEKETIFAVRMQFYAVEIARLLTSSSANCKQRMAQHNEATTAPRANVVQRGSDSQQVSKASDQFQEQHPPDPTWGSLFSFTARGHIGPVTGAIFLSLIVGLVEPAFAIFLGKIFDQFTDFGADRQDAKRFRAKITTYCIYLCALGSASWILNACFFCAWVVFGELQAKDCRARLFDALSQKAVAWFDMRGEGVGALASRVQSQVRELQIGTSQPLGYVLQYTVTACASLGVAFFYCWDLTLVIIATVPVSAFVLSTISRRIQPSIQGQQDRLSAASRSATTCFTNIETVKCFNGQEFEAAAYKTAIRQAARYYLQQAKANALQIAFVRFITLAMFAQGFWYGQHLVSKGTKSTGSVITTFWSCLTATQSFEEILPHMLVLEKARAAGANLHSIVKTFTHNAPERDKPLAAPGACPGSIKLNNVTFTYPSRPHQPVLSNVSLYLASGSTTFLVGKSGSGKSTLGQLLLKFYTPAFGQILLDDRNIEQLETSWLRRQVTLVEQTSVLFEGTVFDNISMASSSDRPATKDEVQSAIEFALLQHTINDLPEGLNTLITSKGGSLSGGQRQRMALARARIRDSPILILDESTSALDHTSRALIMSAIREWRRDRTTIVVTHDLTQIEDNDHVYILEGGMVAKEGFGQFFNTHSTPEDPGAALHSYISNGPYVPRRAGEPLQRPLDLCPAPPFDASMPRHASNHAPDKHGNRSRDRLGSIPAVFGGRGAIIVGPTTTSVIGSPMHHRSKLFRKGEKVESRPGARRKHTDGSLQQIQSSSRRFSKRVSDGAIELLETTGLAAVQNRPTTRKGRRRPVGEELVQLETDGTPVNASSSIEGPQSITAILRTTWPTFDRRTRFLFAMGLVSSVIHAAGTPLFSWVFSKLLGTFFEPQKGSTDALKWSLAIFILATVGGCACFFMHLLLERCGQVWIDNSRTMALDNLLDQPKQFFTKPENNVARLTQSLDRDAEEMRNLLGRFAAFVLVAVVMISVAVLWSAVVCWELTLVALSVGPASFVITQAFQSVSAQMEEKTNTAADCVGAVLDEFCTSIKTVRALTLEDLFRGRYQRGLAVTLRVGLRRALYCGILYGISEAMVFFVNALIFYYGTVLAASHRYSINSILLVFSMLLFSMANLTAIVAFVPQIQSSKDTARRLLQLARLTRASHEHSGYMSLSLGADVVCKDLSFSYPGREDETLHNVSVTFRRGTCTAIVGPSGSGKSTVASLLLRLYPTRKAPWPPQIAVNRRDIAELNAASLRRLIAIVPQTCVLFPLTVAENILYGIPLDSDRRDPEIVRLAASDAGIDEFISSLPSGYQTMVGDGGIGLSGGQAQRIAIARALVRDPSILILDEATSALDHSNAALVKTTIQDFIKKKPTLTVIIITHAQEMMELADNVVMLERGEVVEEGRLDELIERRGKLASLLRGGEWIA